MNHHLLSAALQAESNDEGRESPSTPKPVMGEQGRAAPAAADTAAEGGERIDGASTGSEAAEAGDGGDHPPPGAVAPSFSAHHGLFLLHERENSRKDGMQQEFGRSTQKSPIPPSCGLVEQSEAIARKDNDDEADVMMMDCDENQGNDAERLSLSASTGRSDDPPRHDESVKRRKLRKLVESGYPSFHLLLSANYDNSDDETPDNDNLPLAVPLPCRPVPSTTASSSLSEPQWSILLRPGGPPMASSSATIGSSTAGSCLLQPIYIDVDEEIGLKPKKRRSERHAAISAASEKHLSERNRHSWGQNSDPIPRVVSAADQGYYEGSVAVSMPEDEFHLSELHCWTRRQLEYFSATPDDVRSTHPGGGRRGAPLVAGRVGLRCRHCFAKREEGTEASVTTGAVSFPHNLTGIYAACTQKPTLHFESHCPSLPDPERERLHILMLRNHHPGAAAHPSSSSRRVWAGNNSGSSIPTLTYYLVSAKRLGIVEAGGGAGLRFGRDLALEPLPLETTVRLEEAPPVETAGGAFPGGDESVPSSDPGSLHNEQDSIPSASSGVNGGLLKAAETRIVADEESEQVLAEAVLEPDDPAKRPSRVHDKGRATDFVFLTLQQMAITHAVPTDFIGKGKKTKLMRVGFAGFCCRHCDEPDVLGGGGCRSFSSAADNLSSSISNSFALHLQKCHKVPVRIKKALSAYKRLHQRQLAQLPYGSQRRLIHDLWSRLRANDVTEEEMNERIQLLQPPPSKGGGKVPPGAAFSSEGIPSPLVNATSVLLSHAEIPQARPEFFPECNDVETKQVLRRAMEVWEPAENDFLLLPSDRWLISDFLFLTMRQLKAAFLNGPSTSGGRRSTTMTAGLCCMHCMNEDPRQQVVSPSGRSFPSAPDNFASSMNSSFYSHMQACPFVPADVRRALFNTKKLHSIQCSNLKFGSQRRFFNLLFNRLKGLNRADFTRVDVGGEIMETTSTGQVQNDLPSVEPAFSEIMTLGFAPLHASNAHHKLWECIHCRMVPLPLRAHGSCFTEVSSMMVDDMKAHRAACVGDSFHLDMVANALREYVSVDHPQLSGDVVLQSESFANVVLSCVGGNADLLHVFHRDVLQLVIEAGDNGTGKLATQTLPSMLERSKGLWAMFPTQVDEAAVLDHFQRFVLTHEISSSLDDHPSLVKFMMSIAPGLSLTALTRCDPTSTTDEAKDESIEPQS